MEEAQNGIFFPKNNKATNKVTNKAIGLQADNKKLQAQVYKNTDEALKKVNEALMKEKKSLLSRMDLADMNHRKVLRTEIGATKKMNRDLISEATKLRSDNFALEKENKTLKSRNEDIETELKAWIDDNSRFKMMDL